MSSGRKTYDGSFNRGGFSDSERRDSDDHKIEANEYASTSGTRRLNYQLAEYSDDIGVEESDRDRYLITYADLITLLLGLFIILYAMSSIDLEKYEETVNAFENVFGASGNVRGLESPPDFNQMYPSAPSLAYQLENVIVENGFGAMVKLIQTERGITVSILDDILFASGKANLNENSIDVLSQIANVIKTVNNDLRIEGHTDNIPISNKLFESNWHLSVTRATNTAYYLMNTEKISPDRVSIVGYADYKPVADNETIEGRSQNRRVDIVILNK